MDFGILATLFKTIIPLIFPDKAKAEEVNLEVQKVINEGKAEAYKAQGVRDQAKKDIITTEINSNSIVSNWRGYLMTACSLMIINSWILTPLLNAFLTPLGCPINAVPIPGEAWALMSIGLGGYIGEQGIKTYSNAKVERAKIENAVNEDVLAEKLRATIFKQGMTQAQWDGIKESVEASLKDE